MPPQPPIFSHPWVYSAKITGDTITFRVEVTDLEPNAGDIEISGEATQVGGAFAPIYAIKNLPADAVAGDRDDKDQAGLSFVNVEATLNPDYPFRTGQDVTTFVRVSKAWVTVIGENTSLPTQATSGSKAGDGTTWDKHKADAHIRSLAAPPLQPFSHPWIYSAKITGDTITFRVEVTDFKPDAGDLEISGQATQVGGAFASIYAVIDRAAADPGDASDEDERGRYFVNVKAPRNPNYPFRKGQDVTAFVRVSKTWVTVIGEGTTSLPTLKEPPPKAPDGTTWEDHLADAHVSGS